MGKMGTDVDEGLTGREANRLLAGSRLAALRGVVNVFEKKPYFVVIVALSTDYCNTFWRICPEMKAPYFLQDPIF